MRVNDEKRRELLRSKREWLEKRINEACPLPDGPYWFEYNEFHDFWRAGYHGKTRKMIRHYESIKDIQLGSQYELVIDGSYICIQKPNEHVKNQYETLIANTPMNSPLEPSQIISLRGGRPEMRFVPGSFTTLLKSHVHTCHEKSLLLDLAQFYRDELCPLGYTVQVFFKGRGRDIDYSVVLTHNTETSDACIQLMVNDGFAPYRSSKDKPVTKTKPEVDQEALTAREQELLKELDAVRQQMAK